MKTTFETTPNTFFYLLLILNKEISRFIMLLKFIIIII